MAQAAVRDVVIWAKHIHGPEVRQRVAALRGGQTLDLIVDGVRGTWRKMEDGRDGRPTSGIRPIGRMQEFWRELYASRRGDVVRVELADEGAGKFLPLCPPLAKTEEERMAALERLLCSAKASTYSSEGRTLTRDEMNDRDADREAFRRELRDAGHRDPYG